LKINPNSRVAMETAVKTGMIVLLGETGVSGEQVNFE
jgi:S-adenosylmethionine synthetase